MIVGFVVGAAIVTIAILAIASLNGEDRKTGCTTDIPCQECGMCYGDHFNASLTHGHPYVYPRDLHR